MADRRLKRLLPVARWPSAEEASKLAWFSPLEVGRLRLHDRTWIPAMVPWRASAEGEVTDAVVEWYARFAQGRPGALVVEATGIRDIPSGPLLRIGHERYVEGLTRLARAVREASGGVTRLFIQLIDFLPIKRRPKPEAFFMRFMRVDDALRSRLPAALRSASDDDVRRAFVADERLASVLDAREYESLTRGYRARVTDPEPAIVDLPGQLPELFADAALRAQRAGFDGVELHYAHAYTMASFLSARNTRTDGYGGSREHRVRLPLEVLRRVRNVAQDDFVVGLRFLGDEVIEGGTRIDDACYFAQAFAEAGADFLSVSKGGKFEDAKQPRVGDAAYPYTGPSGHECMPTVKIDGSPFGRNVPLAAKIRAAVRARSLSTPVVAAGGIASPWQAEDAIQAGHADIVAAARQSLADPDWFEKIRQGRGEDVRRCFFTNYCEGLDQKHKAVTCQRWDRDFDSSFDGLRSRDGKRRLTAPASSN